jgi:histidinol dehydrogenase
LSVLQFLRARTWLKMDEPNKLIEDTAAFARIEGLEGHARAAEARSLHR